MRGMHTGSTNGSRNNDIDLSRRSNLPKPFGPGDDFGHLKLQFAAPLLKFVDATGVPECDHCRTECGRLLGEQRCRRIGREGKHSEAIRQVLDHAQRVLADGACRTDHCQIFHVINSQ